MPIAEILLPLLNANEPEARLVQIHRKDQEKIQKGELVFTIETTKAAADLEAPETGFLRLLVREGDSLTVGQRLAVITTDPGEALEFPGTAQAGGDALQMRITQPARALAEALGVDMTTLPHDRLITEAVVRAHAPSTELRLELPPSEKPYILIYGAGGHAKSVIEIIHKAGVHTIAGIVDDNPKLAGTRLWEIPILGSRAVLGSLLARGVCLAANCVGGILDIGVRVRVFETLKAEGFTFPTLAHTSAVVEPSVKIEAGGQIFAHAYIGADAHLEACTIINTGAIISHDCSIGEYSHIAPGALLAGHVQVGARCLVGMGVTTVIGLRIGSGARIGNSAVLLADVPEKAIIQAGSTWSG